MIVNKLNVNDYIKCPFMFGKNILNGRQSTIRLQDMHVNIKKHIGEIASYEMKNDDKLSLSEYRIRYTNKYYTKPSQILEAESIVPKLNNIFEIFANSAFLGYNVPVEIPIPGTSTVYREIVDFILTDDSGNINIIEIVDLSDLDGYKKQLAYWPHYYSVYSYLAASFEQEINVIAVDPNDYIKYGVVFDDKRFGVNDSETLYSLLRAVSSDNLVKNLYACNTCSYNETCH